MFRETGWESRNRRAGQLMNTSYSEDITTETWEPDKEAVPPQYDAE